MAKAPDIKDVSLVRHVDPTDPTIHLPTHMSLAKGAQWLMELQKREESIVTPTSIINGYYFTDALVTATRILSREFGFAIGIPIPGPFGTKTEPTPLPIPTGPKPSDLTTVMLGRFKLPILNGGWIEFGISWPPNDVPGIPTLQIRGEMMYRDRDNFDRLVRLIRQELPTTSIYKGKSFSLDFNYQREGHDFRFPDNCPNFLDLTRANLEDLIFSDDTWTSIESMLVLPIRAPRASDAIGISAKQGTLLSGTYGTGKTELMFGLLRLAQEHGYTAIHCNNIRDLEMALHIAAIYEPAIVVAEDLDRLISGGADDTRTHEVDNILNLIDGPILKGRRVKVICTTNDVDSVRPVALRPGRWNPLVISEPDHAARVEFLRRFGGSHLSPSFNFNAVAAEFEGMIPAMIREILSRAKAVTWARLSASLPDTDEPDLTGRISTEDVLATYRACDLQRRLITPKPTDKRSDLQRAADTLASGLRDAFAPLSTLNSVPALPLND